MRIGILGGSFDPIHTGHAMIASYAAQFLPFDRVWLMVSRHNPLKLDRQNAPEEHRLNMARLVADKIPGVEVSDFEFHRPSPSYTYQTLLALKETYPEHSFSLIIGADNWLDFSRWRNSGEIVKEFGVTVFRRPGYPLPSDLPEGITIVEGAPEALISSTFIRSLLKSGRDANFFVPPEVVEYIKARQLYAGS